MMEPSVRRVITCCHRPAVRQRVTSSIPQRRTLATPSEPTSSSADIQAAAPIQFNNNPDQFSSGRPRASLITSSNNNSSTTPRKHVDLDKLRIVPASPSYFTSIPKYTDDLLHLTTLLRRNQLLPQQPAGEAPRVAWKTRDQYKTEKAESVRVKPYAALLSLLKRLNYIHPALMPDDVTATLETYKRSVQPHLNAPKPITVNGWGVSRAVGRRKSSNVVAHVVEGDGQCLVNDRPLAEYFPRLHDRESAVWALKSTQRLDKYNVWATANGGGTTGQAEAMTLAVAKALMAHEPDLKAALRRAGCVTRDPRRVERKKPGHLKARKMPAWVKR